MSGRPFAIFTSVFLALASIANAQKADNSSLQSLAFLSGKWISENPGEVQEESWSTINGDSMIGSFRVVHGGKPAFYEFWVVEIENNRPVLKLKHFDPGFAGWEEKNASTKMPLTSVTEDDAVFTEPDGGVSLHYHRAADTLICVVHHVKNGKTSDEIFKMTRAAGS